MLVTTDNGLASKLVRENVLSYFRGLNQNDYVGVPSSRFDNPIMQYLESLNVYVPGSFYLDNTHIVYDNGDLEILPVWVRDVIEHLVEMDNESISTLKVKDVVGVLDGSIVREEKVFAFVDLPEKIQEKIYQEWIDSWDGDDWYTDAINNLEADIANETQGENIDISFSGGFWNQGDGASFTGKIHIGTFIHDLTGSEKDYPLICYVMSKGDLYDDYVEVYRTNSHYVHSRSVKVGEIAFAGDATDIEDYLDEEKDNLQSHMQEWVEDRCNEIHSDLEREYESLTSFEYFVEYEVDLDNRYYIDGTLAD